MSMCIGPFGHRLQPTSVATAKADDGQDTKRRDAMKQACRDFESLFVTYMLKQMRQTVAQDGLFGADGPAANIYTSMMDSEVAKEISRQRGIGLAPMMYRQMMAALHATPTKK